MSLFFVALGLALIATDVIAAQTVGEIGLFLTLIGLACWFAAFLLLRSLWPVVRIMRRQQAGAATRYGVFIGAEALLIHTDLDLTLIPRQNAVRLDGLRLYYTWNDKPKTLSLPGQLVGTSSDALMRAVQAWLAG